MAENTAAFDGRGLDVDRAGFLSQHDVVYLSPAVDGYEGFPLGNGDLGAMAWTPPDKLFFRINKTNTWDDAPREPFTGWQDANEPDKSERFTSLRSCGEFRIEPGLPVFDWMYLEDFEGRLSLDDAQATWGARGPLGQVACRSFVAADPPVMVVHYEDELTEPVVRRAVLARWGSRVFEHWYRFIRREFRLGPEGTAVGCEGDEVWVEQPTRSLRFAMACKLVGPSVEAQLFNSREGGYVLDTGDTCAFDAFISVVTNEEAADPLAEARAHVRRAAEMGTTSVFEGHRRYWSDFWSQSLVELPDDYLENLWYLNGYQVGSSARGDYPPHFIGSIWGWNRDARPWNHYFQWNQQHYTWPLHASGHPELMLPYAKWKLESLPGAMEAARSGHDCDGAFYSDISDRHGTQDINLANNTGATALTALDLWRHYEYTLDRDYLQTYAYPILREIVRFYLNKLEKWDDGKYHMPEALPNETPEDVLCSDTSNDLAGVRKVFPAFVAAAEELGVDEELRQRAEQVVADLADYVMTEVPPDVKTWGDLKPGDALIAYGTLLDTGLPGHCWSKRPYWMDGASSEMPLSSHAVNAQLMPVYPANLVGLDDEGSKLFEALRNAALCFDPVSASGHTPIPICYARLGMTEYLPDILERWVDDYQHFSQGLFSYFKRSQEDLVKRGMAVDRYHACQHNVLGLTNDVKVIFSDPEERLGLPRRPFAHMGLESGSVLEATINEMLLQSHDGKLRVFPAVPDDWEARFTLHAQGAFVVTSERADGQVKYVAVESRKGQPCCLVNPWGPREKVCVRETEHDEALLEVESAEVLNFPTEAGKVYVVERAGKPVSSFGHETISGVRNSDAKTRGHVRLGIPRQF